MNVALADATVLARHTTTMSAASVLMARTMIAVGGCQRSAVPKRESTRWDEIPPAIGVYLGEIGVAVVQGAQDGEEEQGCSPARHARGRPVAGALRGGPVGLGVGLPLGVTTGADTIRHATAEARAGMFVLGLLPLLGGLLTHGLTRRWGEVYPRWIPRMAGRPIHPAVAIVPASLAAVLIVTAELFVYRAELNTALGRVPAADPDVTGRGAWVPGLFWLPWGVALTGATYAYWRRRRVGPAPSENTQTAPVTSRR